jgi:hypothetical protein
MAVRLGEMLLHGGALTEEQLEEALSAQSVYGGRLGTNLVEMGLLSEDELARLLNQKLGVPSVDAASLELVPAALIGILPKEMVQRFRVLPVALDGKRLTLAMADPADFSAIDEIGFVTGLVIVPRVCSELRLTMALERYYGIKRSIRFIPVAGGVRTRMARLTREEVEGRSAEACAHPAPDAGLSSEPDRLSDGPGPDHDSRAGRDSVSCQESPAVPPLSTKISPGTIAGSAFSNQARSMEAISVKLAAVSGEGEVVTILMSYLRDAFDRAGLLSLRRGSVVGVQAVADGAGLPAFTGCVIELEGAALLKGVLEKRAPFLGSFPEGGAESLILEKIGANAGAVALLLPLVVNKVSAAVIIVEDENGRLGTGLAEVQRIVAKAEFAFEMVSLKRKICQM